MQRHNYHSHKLLTLPTRNADKFAQQTASFCHYNYHRLDKCIMRRRSDRVKGHSRAFLVYEAIGVFPTLLPLTRREDAILSHCAWQPAHSRLPTKLLTKISATQLVGRETCSQLIVQCFNFFTVNISANLKLKIIFTKIYTQLAFRGKK